MKTHVKILVLFALQIAFYSCEENLDFESPASSTTSSYEILALKTGQAYATLSICFNGSRGIMYQLESKKFIIMTNHIVGSKIAQAEQFLSSAFESHHKPHFGLKISTLYLK